MMDTKTFAATIARAQVPTVTRVGGLDPKSYPWGPVAMAEWRCDVCGHQYEACDVAPQDRRGPPPCPKCREAREERERIAAEERGRQAHEERRRDRIEYTRTNLPLRFQWASSLDVPELRQRVRPASIIAKAKSLVTTKENVVLLGDAGLGKTSLACALLCEIAAHMNVTGMFVNSFEIAEARRQHRLGQGEPEIIDRALEAGILLIDELGAEQSKDLAVDELIRARHDGMDRTIFTTGFSQAFLTEKYGAGVARRIFEGSAILRLGGR